MPRFTLRKKNTAKARNAENINTAALPAESTVPAEGTKETPAEVLSEEPGLPLEEKAEKPAKKKGLFKRKEKPQKDTGKTAGRKKKKRIVKGFVTYGSYQPDINLMKNAGSWYFKVYEADPKGFSEEKIKAMMPDGKIRTQIIVKKGKVYFLPGIKGGNIAPADEALSVYKQYDFLKEISADEWISLMSENLREEPFSLPLPDIDFPELEPVDKNDREAKKERRKEEGRRRKTLRKYKKIRQKKNLQKVQPYQTKATRKTITITGREYKCLMLMGFPSKIFSAFTTELLSLSPEHIEVAIHAAEIDKEMCLKGLDILKDISDMRKETMRKFIGNADKKGMKLIDCCTIITINGLPGEIERIFGDVQEYCSQNLIGISELDYQQAMAWKSTLPMLNNQMKYNAVLSEDNFKGLMPWSLLADRHEGVLYGKDSFGRDIYYDRSVSRENAFILSTDYEWCLEETKKELAALKKKGMEAVIVTEAKDPDGTEEKVNWKEMPGKIYKAGIKQWVLSSISTTGTNSKQQISEVEKAEAEAKTAENYKEAFIAALPENRQAMLKNRPFPDDMTIHRTQRDGFTVYAVDAGKSTLEKMLAYAYALNKAEGIVFALNCELISSPGTFFIPKDETVYTITAKDMRKLYADRNLGKLISTWPALRIGEHRTYEKLQLTGIIRIGKTNRKIISEPAEGSLLYTELATYRLMDREEG